MVLLTSFQDFHPLYCAYTGYTQKLPLTRFNPDLRKLFFDSASGKTITALNALNNRNIQVPIQAILIVESVERMCNLRLTTGEMYLYMKRLKYAEADFCSNSFIRINNQMIVNIKKVQQFAPTANARIEIILSDGSTYFISRHYIVVRISFAVPFIWVIRYQSFTTC
ncbi:LytTR family DNA-binding domain-containing protein [Acetobacterium bakii]|uniref:HTH LytTR-type domain-containing protein n=1 Tax=Acetobacterium bakii TaxID=52689 RepID=A0A0L6U2M3_9FIRM|nr:hypothetical protein AKG39_04870 [Acetobacterium bakii]